MLITESGESFPYSVSFDSDGYNYNISVVWNERDGELVIFKAGVHIEFDDDGSWLDFNFSPESLFPNCDELSNFELDRLLSSIALNAENATLYTKDQIKLNYKNYAKEKFN